MVTYASVLLVFDRKVEDSPLSIYRFRGEVVRLFTDSIYTQHIAATPQHPHSTNDPSYPLIQYRSYKGMAALLGLGAGAERLLADKPLLQQLLGTCLKASAELIDLTTHVAPRTYTLKGWVPFNNHGYEDFLSKEPQAQFAQLNRTLSGGIRAFWDKLLTDEQRPLMKAQKQGIDVRILRFSLPYYKDIYVSNQAMKWRAYDLVFTVNLHLPEYMGLGKVASKGNGVLYW